NDPAHLDRLQDGERVEAAGAADVDPDVLQSGGGLDGRELEGDRPARLAADLAQLALHVQVVDLYDHAVDLVVERLAPLLPAERQLHDLLEVVAAGVDGIDVAAELL